MNRIRFYQSSKLKEGVALTKLIMASTENLLTENTLGRKSMFNAQ